MIRHKKISSVPIQRLVPNFITIIGLCLGISSIRYALDDKWVIAVSLILIAGFLDGIDGRLARMLNVTSKFGAQLDSLADIVSFGVAPAILIYLWSLHEIPIKGVGWSFVLFYVTCSALRLARFNAALEDPKEKNKSMSYFTGLPMPSAAGISLIPLILTFDLCTPDSFNYFFVAPYITFVGFLMVSRIPLFSFKNISIKSEIVPLVLVMTAILIAGILVEPWILLPLFGIAYLATIPLSVYTYWKSGQK